MATTKKTATKKTAAKKAPAKKAVAPKKPKAPAKPRAPRKPKAEVVAQQEVNELASMPSIDTGFTAEEIANAVEPTPSEVGPVAGTLRYSNGVVTYAEPEAETPAPTGFLSRLFRWLRG